MPSPPGRPDARRQPVPGAVVFWSYGTIKHRVAADDQGRFRITGVPNRPLTLVAYEMREGSAFTRATPGVEVEIVLR